MDLVIYIYSNFHSCVNSCFVQGDEDCAEGTDGPSFRGVTGQSSVSQSGNIPSAGCRQDSGGRIVYIVLWSVMVCGASTLEITGCFQVATGKDKKFYLTHLFNNLK